MSNTQAVPVTDDDVRRQLNRILEHKDFRQRERMGQMLRFVVEETLGGRGVELKQYTVAVRGLGLSPRFDPQLNSLIRNHARRLRKLLEEYYGGPGHMDPVRIRLDSGSYVPTFCWNTIAVAEEGTPAIELQTEHKPPPEPLPGSAKIEARHDAPPAIAVVEFANLGMEGEWRHFPMGLTEELMMALGQSPGLAVMGPFERSRLAAERVSVHDLSAVYGAAVVLDGSVQYTEDLLKVRVRLLDGGSKLQVWGSSYSFDPRSERLPAIEQAIVTHVCQFLGHEFGVVNRFLLQRATAKPVGGLSAYEAILRSHRYLLQFTEESLLDAIAAAEYAVQVAPNSAVAWSGLGAILASSYLWPMMDTASFPKRALSCAERALQLDEYDPWVLYGAGFVKRLAGDPEGDLLFRRLQLRPCPPVIMGIAAVADIYNKVDNNAALERIERAQQLNPHYPRYLHYGACLVYLDRGDDVRALAELDAQDYRNHYTDPLIRGAIYARMGRYAEAEGQVRRVTQLYPNFATRGFALLGRYHHRDYLVAISERLAPLQIDWL